MIRQAVISFIILILPAVSVARAEPVVPEQDPSSTYVIWVDETGNVVWSNAADDNVVWGNNIVWGDNVVWSDNVVWGNGPAPQNDNVVWGNNIVWGDGPVISSDNVVWANLYDDDGVWRGVVYVIGPGQ